MHFCSTQCAQFCSSKSKPVKRTGLQKRIVFCAGGCAASESSYVSMHKQMSMQHAERLACSRENSMQNAKHVGLPKPAALQKPNLHSPSILHRKHANSSTQSCTGIYHEPMRLHAWACQSPCTGRYASACNCGTRLLQLAKSVAATTGYTCILTPSSLDPLGLDSR